MTGGHPRPRQPFPRSNRLRRRSDFLRIQASRVRVQARLFIALLDCRPDSGPCRLGIVASRKVGGAVERNRAKRLVREAFRSQAHLFPDQRDVDADLFRAAPAICRRAAELPLRRGDS
jgi:ribonuclease P protein component